MKIFRFFFQLFFSIFFFKLNFQEGLHWNQETLSCGWASDSDCVADANAPNVFYKEGNYTKQNMYISVVWYFHFECWPCSNIVQCWPQSNMIKMAMVQYIFMLVLVWCLSMLTLVQYKSLVIEHGANYRAHNRILKKKLAEFLISITLDVRNVWEQPTFFFILTP